MASHHILIAAQSAAFGHALLNMLSHQRHDLTLVRRGTEVLSHLSDGHVDLCLLQDRLLDGSGLERHMEIDAKVGEEEKRLLTDFRL